LLCQNHAALGQVHPEPAAEQQKQGRALLARHPLRTLVTLGMDRPFDLNIITVPGHHPGGFENAKAATVNKGVCRGITQTPAGIWPSSWRPYPVRARVIMPISKCRMRCL
jgi:hypothetical protein